MRRVVLLSLLSLLGAPSLAEPQWVATHPPHQVHVSKKDQYAVSAQRILRALPRQVVILDPASGQETGALKAPDGWVADFANAIAMDGGRALVCHDGIPELTVDVAERVRQSLLYDLNTGTVIQRFDQPKSSTGRDNWKFGDACAIDGDTVAIAAPGDTSRRKSTPKKLGSVLLYDATTGALKHRLFSPYPQDTAAFGKQVFLSNGRLLVSQSAGGWNTDSRYAIYAYDARTGALIDTVFELEPGDRWFVRFFAVDGDRLAVSLLTHPWARKNGTQNRTLVLDIETGDPVAGFLPPNAEVEGYGVALAFQDDHLLIGARGQNGTNEHVFLYNATSGALLKTFRPEHPDVYFGLNLDVSDDTVVIEQRLQQDWDNQGRSAHIYRLPQTD